MRPETYRLLALASCVLIVGAACGGAGQTDAADGATEAPENLKSAAEDEGQLTLYYATGRDETTEWIAPFEEEYGIDVSHYRASTSTVYGRWLQEAQANQQVADAVIVSGTDVWGEAVNDGLAAEYSPSNAEQFAAEAKLDGYSYSLFFYTEALTWNTDVTSNAENTVLADEGENALISYEGWEDGSIGIVVPHSANPFYAQYRSLTEEYGWDFWRKIASYDPVLYESSQPAADGILRGEHAVVLALNDAQMGRELQSGADYLRWKYREPATAGMYMVGVSANAPNPNAARQFVEWATDTEAIESLAENSQGRPGRDDVSEERSVTDESWFNPPEELDVSWMEDPSVEEERDAFLAEWSSIMGYGG